MHRDRRYKAERKEPKQPQLCWRWPPRSTHAAAILVALATLARAQMAAPADANLFGEDVKSQPTEQSPQGGFFSPSATNDYSQLLVFNDGRQLRGELLEINKEDIVWKRRDADAPLHFPRIEVRRVLNAGGSEGGSFFSRFFGANAGNAGNGKNDGIADSTTLKLTGGDWLFGHTTSADGQSFQVKLKDGTHFTVARAQMKWLSIGHKAAPAFGFFGTAFDMEGWLPASASMRVDDKTLVVDGAPWIGRPVNSAKRLEISFELPQDTEEGTRLWIQPFSPRPNCYGVGTAELRFGRKQITRLLYYQKFDRINSDVPKEDSDNDAPTKYRVFFDAVEKRVVVLRNGSLAGDWKFVEDKEEVLRVNPSELRINGICFDREERGQGAKPLKFNALRVEPWDGVLPKEGETAAEQDRLTGPDATAIFGKLESLEKKKLTFAGTERPLADGGLIRFAGSAVALLAGADAKLEFGEQGEFVVRNLEAKGGKLHCETNFASALELPMHSLQKITFKANVTTGVAGADMLVFKNGDELTGKLLNAHAPGSIRWRTAAGQEVEFQPERIAGIRMGFGENQQSAKPVDDAALVELRTGERWRGKLLALDDKQLRLEHSLLGSLALDRKNIWHLFPNPRLEICDGGQAPDRWFYKKPESMNGRHVAQGPGAEHWVYLDGTYVLRSDDANIVYNTLERPGLSHEINPDLERFELRWEARATGQNTPNFIFNLSDKGGTGLNATFSYSELTLSVINSKARNQNRWREIPLEDKIGPSDSTRAVRLFIDTKAGSCDIVINGVVVTRLGQVEGERLLKGTYTFRIQPYYQNGPIVLSNVWIGPWNGDLPFAVNETAGATMLANGDVAAGTPKKIEAGRFKIDYEQVELELPLEKAFSVDFGGNQEKQEAAAKIRLVDGSTVNLKSFQWDGQQLTGQSALWGEIHLSANSIEELIFDPALPRIPTTVSNRKLAQKNTGDAGAKAPH